MEVYKCKMCDAMLEVGENDTIVVCSYCGAQHDIQKEQEHDFSPNTEALLKRISMFLEEGDFERANEYCEKVLDMDPECAEAYLKKLMVDLHVTKQENLKECAEPFDKNLNYKRFIQFAAPSLAAVLAGYLANIVDRNEAQRKEDIYQKAIANRRRANKSYSFRHVAEEFQLIPGYKDADEQAKECLELSKKVYLREAQIAQEELQAKEQAAKKRKKICMIAAASMIVIVLGVIWFSIISKNQKLKEANSCIEAGKYQEAYDILQSLDYKNSQELLVEIQPNVYKERLEQISIGDIIRMGTYKQEKGSAKETEIEWMVLDEDDGKYLLLTKYALDYKLFHDYFKDVEWKESTLRGWLNETFAEKAFSDYEQSLIIPVCIIDEEEAMYSFDKTSDDMDRVFLLRAKEVYEYNLDGLETLCKATNYVRSKNSHINNNRGYCEWWLRSTGNGSKIYMDLNGEVNYEMWVSTDEYCVRPAIWISAK